MTNSLPDVQAQTQGPILAKYRFVFIVTYGRSGSTLLQSILNSTKDVQIRGENNNVLFNLYKAMKSARLPTKMASAPIQLQPDRPWYGYSQIRLKKFEKQLLDSFVRHVLVPDDTARVIGFKEIRHLPTDMATAELALYIDFLLNNFPHAKVVFNARNAEDVSNSAFMAVSETELRLQQIRELGEIDELFKTYDSASDRTIFMQYEDYVKDHSLIHRMLDFLQLEWSYQEIERAMAKRLNHGKLGQKGS